MKPKTFLHWLFLGVLLLGIFFRFYNLDRKVFWHDEAHTPLRAAGYTWDDWKPLFASGDRISVPELRRFHQLEPDRGWDKTLTALKTHPEHPPLYYLGARVAMSWIDNPILATRGLAAAISLWAFPSLYWLMRELFIEPKVAQVALALFAVSPFQILYAQEARQYSLLTVATLASSAALLRALRLRTQLKIQNQTTAQLSCPLLGRGAGGEGWQNDRELAASSAGLKAGNTSSPILHWLPYAVTVAVGLNTSIFFVFAIAAHGIYVALFEKFGRASRKFGLALAFGGATFLPWAILIATSLQQVQAQTTWLQTERSWSDRLAAWGLHISNSFLDLSLPLTHPFSYLVPPIFLVLGVWAFWFLWQQGYGRAAIFIALLIGINFVALALPDVLWGGQRSLLSRYMSQFSLGFEMLLAALIGSLLAGPRGRDRAIGRGLLAILLACGLVSCFSIARAPTWWTKTVGRDHAAIAEVLNRRTAPVVLVKFADDTTLGNALSLSYLMRPDGTFADIADAAVPADYPDCEVFLYRPRGELLDRWQQSPGIELETFFWRSSYGSPLARMTRLDAACDR